MTKPDPQDDFLCEPGISFSSDRIVIAECIGEILVHSPKKIKTVEMEIEMWKLYGNT